MGFRAVMVVHQNTRCVIILSYYIVIVHRRYPTFITIMCNNAVRIEGLETRRWCQIEEGNDEMLRTCVRVHDDRWCITYVLPYRCIRVPQTI